MTRQARGPILHGLRQGTARGAVLVLHGGKVASAAAAEPWQLSSLRMVPFTRDLRRTLGTRSVVTQLQYRYRGWNGDERSPVADATWACDQLVETCGDDVSITVVGHSMGGRAAAAIAGHPAVTAVAALAPWWPDGTETDTMRKGQRLLVVHGSVDRWTDPVASRAATERASDRGVEADFVPIAGAGHFMVRSAGTWARLVREFVIDQSREVSPTKPE